jgi:catechol 2,3-dioxygenase-like lactoylglutathione lyase family enzyme
MKLRSPALLLGLLACSLNAYAQLPAAGNATGVATGHIHLSVPDVAKHRAIWLDFGASEASSGRLQLLGFPGIYFLLTEREPTGPSAGSTANHIGFLVRDFDAYMQKLAAHGATIAVENEGIVLADLPDGFRIEFRQDANIAHPIEFHHMHLMAADPEAIRDWYVDLFGAESSSRMNLPSALVPGGRVDFLPSDEAPAGTQGRAIDHIGFEVDDMDAFAARVRAKGIKFDREPAEIEAIGLKIAFLTDPIGTYIEITEGLRGK